MHNFAINGFEKVFTTPVSNKLCKDLSAFICFKLIKVLLNFSDFKMETFPKSMVNDVTDLIK